MSRVLKYAGSFWVTALLGMGVMAPYIYFTFGENPYQHWIHLMFQTTPGLLLFALLLLNLVLTSILVLRERFRSILVTQGSVQSMDSFLELPAERFGPGGVEQWLRSKGFHPKVADGGLVARKWTYSIIAGTVFRLGLVLLLLSFALSLHLRQSDELVIEEGSQANLMGNDVIVRRIEAALPDEFFQVGDKATFRLGNVSAVIESRGEKTIITSGYPSGLSGADWKITHLGYFQELSYKGEKYRVPLDILPPGRTHAEVLENGTTISFTLEPEKTLAKGLLKGKTFDLSSPAYRMDIKQGKEKREPVVMNPGEKSGDISLGTQSLYIKLLAVRDPALPWLRAGFIISIAGAMLVFLRMFWYEKKFLILTEEGSVLIGYSEEHFPKWGTFRFQRWIDEFMEEADKNDSSGKETESLEPQPTVDESESTETKQ